MWIYFDEVWINCPKSKPWQDKMTNLVFGLPSSSIKKMLLKLMDNEEKRKRAREEMKKKCNCKSMRGLGEGPTQRSKVVPKWNQYAILLVSTWNLCVAHLCNYFLNWIKYSSGVGFPTWVSRVNLVFHIFLNDMCLRPMWLGCQLN